MMLFHDCSTYINEWITKQPCVKEESLTDWLLFDISNKQPNIYYQAFSRHEESYNGSDWEWWVLTQDQYNSGKFNAYRFLVQAKKLLPAPKDNYPLVNYGNRNGLQIDLLLRSAANKEAFPLYMFYSNAQPDIEAQIKNIDIISESILRWCDSCKNGGYLASASKIYEVVLGKKRLKYLDTEVLNYSCKLSLCDMLFGKSGIESDKVLSQFNQLLIKKFNANENTENFKSNYHGIKHSGNKIPNYVSLFIKNRGQEISWFENEMHRDISDIGGLGIIDLREIPNNEF